MGFKIIDETDDDMEFVVMDTGKNSAAASVEASLDKVSTNVSSVKISPGVPQFLTADPSKIANDFDALRLMAWAIRRGVFRVMVDARHLSDEDRKFAEQFMSAPVEVKHD